MIWAVLFATVVTYVVYKLCVFAFADADLAVLNRSLKPDYFTGKVVWVTGASSGIGEALCYRLSKYGAKLILSARSVDKLQHVQEKLASPENARVLYIDLGDEDSIRTAVQEAPKLFGRIDILINNAGVSMRSTFLEMNEDIDRKIMQLDYFAPRALTKAVLPDMISQGYGHIVNISSFAGKFGVPMRSSYCAAKHAILGMMNGIRYEFIGKNIHITNVCPGFVSTDVAKNALTKDGLAFGKTTKFIAKGLTADRCAELTLIAVSNLLHEAWPSKQPALLMPYMSAYLPYVGWLMMKSKAKDLMNVT